MEITTPFLEYQFLYIQCFQMNTYSFEKEAKYKFKLKFKCEKIYNLKKFEESFPFFSNLLFWSTFHRHHDLRLEMENLLLHIVFRQKYVLPTMHVQSWPDPGQTPDSTWPRIDLLFWILANPATFVCDENPYKINSIWLRIFGKHLRKFIFREAQWNLISTFF